MKVSYDLKFEKFLDLWSKAEKVKTKRHSISLVHCILKVSIPMLRQTLFSFLKNPQSRVLPMLHICWHVAITGAWEYVKITNAL